MTTEKQRQPKFFYLIPGQTNQRLDGESRWQHVKRLLLRGKRQLPSGGVRIIYQHCEMLNRNGYHAYPVHLGNFTVDWFEHRISELTENEFLSMVTGDDILICPEIIPAAAVNYAPRSKVGFVQNWALVEKGTGLGKSYEDFGFTSILVCSNYLKNYMEQCSKLPIDEVVNGIDLQLFHADSRERKPGSVLYLNRRNVEDAREAIKLLPSNLAAEADFIELENKYSQRELAAHYRRADIFLAIGYPEGFSLPPLEAMACGCAVAGFTGGGGLEHMEHEKTALIAPDGDVGALSNCLQRLLTDHRLKEKIRNEGMNRAQQFSLSHMEDELLGFARTMVLSEKTSP
ncbi:MAG: glycosyltransferase family 4 protein [Desulfobulbaceae bacterium]|nr:glycosyltransferase family 4 protein [Desulfobulbaceae bacterium]